MLPLNPLLILARSWACREGLSWGARWGGGATAYCSVMPQRGGWLPHQHWQGVQCLGE